MRTLISIYTFMAKNPYVKLNYSRHSEAGKGFTEASLGGKLGREC